jgi:hypothetical protein
MGRWAWGMNPLALAVNLPDLPSRGSFRGPTKEGRGNLEEGRPHRQITVKNSDISFDHPPVSPFLARKGDTVI